MKFRKLSLLQICSPKKLKNFVESQPTHLMFCTKQHLLKTVAIQMQDFSGV
jgi:hypothetical protein